MPNAYKELPMFLDNVFLGLIGIREDQIDYFGIVETTAIPSITTGRKQHQRNIFSERLDDENTITRTVRVNRSNKPRNREKRRVNAGKKIKLPTELVSTPSVTTGTTAKSTVRNTTINFPGNVSNYEIARWLNAKVVSHKPTFFYSPSGARQPINVAVAPAPAPNP